MKVFISHSSADKGFVKKLKVDLNANYIQTWVDEDELNFGDILLEKLDKALEESSHFIIILSELSVSSEWVKYELKRALVQEDSNFVKKIIPVKYSRCIAPPELEKMLYEDLSGEVREVVGDRVEFSTKKYNEFLQKLCTSIRKLEMTLTSSDKKEIRHEIVAGSSGDIYSGSIIKASYIVLGFDSTDFWENVALAIRSKVGSIREINVTPVLLPPLLRHALPGLQIGDEFFFSKDYNGNEIAHFGGYRRDDLAMIVDYRIRKALSIEKKHRYNIEIDSINKKFTFITK